MTIAVDRIKRRAATSTSSCGRPCGNRARRRPPTSTCGAERDVASAGLDLATDPQSHDSHFRGSNDADQAKYDPDRTGWNPFRDPSIYPLGNEQSCALLSTNCVEIDGHYTFQLVNTFLPRVEAALAGELRYRPEFSTGELVLFSTVAPLAGTVPCPGLAGECPGLVAGSHIAVRDSEGLANGDDAVDGALGKRIRIFGYTNLGDVLPGPGWLDVNVDGNVELKEVVGDMRVGIVRSRTNDVKLTAAGSIIDADVPGETKTAAADTRDVEGVNIKLTAGGSIGTETDFVETNLHDGRHGPQSASSTRMRCSACS